MELSKAYEFSDVEKKWGAFWLEKGFFKADAHSPKPAYCISIPPPNVTGVLHMGHALVNTLQDLLVRYKRMQGFEALWVPGTDHAGIATQTIVERDQIAKSGKRRKDFSREEFLKLVWEWKEKSEQRILAQLKRLGCSCDWDRLAFTMDEPRSRAVRSMFKKMFDAGLIYRGDYLVNWDPVTQTALADDEVEYEEQETFLWQIFYPLEDGTGGIVIATTRPEVMLGDTAVAVHPSDERYQEFIGKRIRLPITDRLIPIIADSAIDPQFGTGAVKITPAHDPVDYEMAQRHKLPLLNVLTPDAKIIADFPEFAGLSVSEARKAIVKKLKTLGLLKGELPYRNRVGISYRSKAVIEPYLSKQWFVSMSPFKEPLLSAVREGRVKLIPKDWEQTYFHWIENLRDWCISRQLWWGHRIPVWYSKKDPTEMICLETGEADPDKWVQDEDVLDTWFSSALWPFSVLGWPDKTPDLAKFYPNSTLITGHDILFFWVARMILMGEYALKEPPFPETFLHGLIYGKSYWRIQKDGGAAYLSAEERLRYDLGEAPPSDVHFKWEKMSKSKGNVIDPIEIIEGYGTDAMRIALVSSATHARQIDLDRRRFEEYKNFINKIWNGARFVFMNLADLSPEELAKGIDRTLLTLEDRWILSRLNQVILRMHDHFAAYAFDRVATELYEFFWNEFCAYYVELAKPTLSKGSPAERANKQRILCVLLCNALRLMHPVIPFITEELFAKLQEQLRSSKRPKDLYVAETLQALEAPACMMAPYPTLIQKSDISSEAEETFAYINQVVHAIRTIRAEMQLSPGTPTALFIQSEDKQQLEKVRENTPMIQALVRLSSVAFNTQPPKGFSASAVVSSLKLVIPLPDEMREKEKVRLTKEKEKAIAKANGAREKLANPDFLSKAPPELVAKFQQNLQQAERELTEISAKLDAIS